MSLPQEQAAQLLSKLPPRQIEAVATEIAKSRSITAEEQQSAILEFADADPQATDGGRGGFDIAKTLVEKALGNASRALDHIRQSIDPPPFGFLRHVDARDLSAFVVDEHPQTIALVLSHLPASYAAAIVPNLADERQSAVLRRIAAMGEVHPEIVQEVAHLLERRMAQVICQQFDRAGGAAAVGEILHETDRAARHRALENLAREDPELAAEVRGGMFEFADIDKFSELDIQTISKNVDSGQWAGALAGADDELKQNVLGKLSSRVRELVEKETERLGPVQLATIEHARRQIVDIVRRLHDAGEIRMRSVAEANEFFH
ncbi:MAG: flagellar motor switch protein FliG [Planctomycetia bacterium]|nr:flagellar motor switch protein FliG [Planctomycetia bacterium]